MKITQADTVLVETFWRNEYQLAGRSIDIATEFQHIHPVARVIGVGPAHDQAMSLRPGDWVMFSFHDVLSVGRLKGIVRWKKIDNKVMGLAYTHAIQAKITEKAAKEIMEDKKIVIDWAEHASAIGRKVFVQLDNQKEVTDMGIHIPSIANKPVSTGVIINVGDGANTVFEKAELYKGLRVALMENRSGGELPYQNFRETNIVRCNSHEVVAVHENGEWRPVGGRLLVKPFMPEFERTEVVGTDSVGRTFSTTGYKMAGSSIIMPGSSTVVPTLAHVVSCGSGWSGKHGPSQADGSDGPVRAKPGDLILMKDTYNNKGEVVFGNQHMKVGGETYLMLQNSFVDAIVEDESVSSFKQEQKMPDMGHYMGFDEV